MKFNLTAFVYRYDEDSEGGVLEDDEDDVLFNGESHHPHLGDPSNEDCFETDSDSDEEVIEIRTSSTPIHRSRPNAGRSSSSSSSSSSSRSRSSGTNPKRNYNNTPTTTRRSSYAGFRSGPALLRTPSSEKEHMTIAPIAPTILKSKGVGNGPCSEDDDYDYPNGEERKWYSTGTDIPVHLVYVPPLGSNYSMDTSAIDVSIGDDVYRHREAYFSVGTGEGRNGNANGQIPSVGVPRTSSSEQASAYFAAPAISSPKHREDEDEDAYDYFGGPDLGDLGFSDRKRPRREIRTDDVMKEGQASAVRYAQVGASSVVGGRSTGPPEVVVSGTQDEGRSRSRSRSRSKSRTPSPAECTAVLGSPTIPPPTPSVAVPRVGSSHTGVSPSAQSHSSSLLSPQDATPSRGRSSTPVLENQPRGRSSTRGSTSDRERSSSRGTSSPLGSISPEGSAVTIAIGAFGVSANGRDPRNFAAERGRDRGGKKLVTEAARTSSPQAPSTASTSSISESSTPSGSSTSTVTPISSPTSLRIKIDGSTSSGSITPVPATEEEKQRAKHYTPANSPIIMRPRQFPLAPAQVSSPSTTVPLSPKGIVSHNTPTSPSSPKPDDGLVGRALGMAGAFVGSFWSGS